jgi:glycosyltransferase involved in cell wall biosynthesis
VLGSSPQLFAAWAAQRLARHFRVPFVFEVRDLWPETFVSLGHMAPRNPLVRVLAGIERHLYRTSDRIVSLLPGAGDYIVEHGGDPDKIHWVPNGIDLSLVPPLSPLPRNDKFTVVYAGAHGAANGLDKLLDAAKLIQRQSPGQHIRIRLIGDGPEKARLQRRTADEGIDVVEFLPPVAKDGIYRSLFSADAFLMLLEDSPVFRWGISPNKLFDYLACARPVLFSVSSPFDPIAEARAGISVKPGDAHALAQGILQLSQVPIAERAAMGLRGRAYVERHHDLRILGDRLQHILALAAGGAPAAHRPRRAA